MKWYGSVEILGGTQVKNEKQIPHPAKSAGIRDDIGAGARGFEMTSVGNRGGSG